MKKYLLLLMGFLFMAALQAQIPQLPEILQSKFEQEQPDLTMTYDETENIKSEEEYYYYISRDMGVDTLLGYRWNVELGQWDLRARIIETYSSDELLAEKLFQVWTIDSTWLDGLYFEYTYNEAGNLTEMVIQYWKPDSAVWVNHFRKTQTYNDDGLLTDINTFWWHCWAEEWVNHHHKIFTYDADILVADTVKIFHHMDEEWMDFLYNEFTYNEAGMKIVKTNYFKHMGMGEWLLNFRWNYAYDSTGALVTQITGQDWHAPLEEWEDFNRYNYTYDVDGNVIYYLYEKWNHFDSTWKGIVQIDYFYDASGFLSQYVMQHKPMCLDEWANVKQAFFTYDADGNMIEKIVQLWNPEAEDWVNFEKWEMLLDYKGGIVGIGDPLASGGIRAVFPNPYQYGDKITFEGLGEGNYTLSVIDLTGRLLEKQSYIPGQSVSIKVDYRTGTHLLILSADNRMVYRGKIVLTR